MKREGGWVFISHSHKDIAIVREIRNQMEDSGFEPLMFYLKCLSDKDEIESLIKREIDEREWFIYVESENSLKSNWVKSERDYISKLSGKKVFTIDINSDITEQVNTITKQLKVFISFLHKDREIFEILKQALVGKDFLVYDPYDEPIDNLGNSWSQGVYDIINDTVRNGFVLLLISEGVNNSFWVKREIELAFAAGGKIIPIYIGNATLDDTWDLRIKILQGIRIDINPTNEQIESVISFILHRINYYEL